MGTGTGGPKANTKSKRKWFKKNVMSVKRRTKDLDQIQDEIRALAEGKLSMDHYKNEDKAGGGQFYCVPCSRSFMNGAVLLDHEKTKPHRKRLKIVAEPQYTQKEADLGAGRTTE